MYFLINFLTISRIILAVVIFILLSLPDKYLYALLLFIFAGISDYFDGYLARKHGMTSDIGEILDPIADKILISFVLIGLALNLSSYILGFSAAIIISREIWISGLRDLNSRKNNIDATKVTFLAKIKTTIQLFTIFMYLVALTFEVMILIVISDILIVIAMLITVYTGYIYTINSVYE
tara:strand:+ start:1307 stop:1843 length:537 start_codon:yes stop_codon:yes gene_type:complete